MIYKKKISGAFLNKGEDFKNGDIAFIANEGKQVEGKFGKQDVFLIKLQNGIEGNVSFNTTTLNNLIDGYGEDSLNWIGKEIKVTTMKQNVQGKIATIYYFFHPKTVLNEDTGQFEIPEKDIFTQLEEDNKVVNDYDANKPQENVSDPPEEVDQQLEQTIQNIPF